MLLKRYSTDLRHCLWVVSYSCREKFILSLLIIVINLIDSCQNENSVASDKNIFNSLNTYTKMVKDIIMKNQHEVSELTGLLPDWSFLRENYDAFSSSLDMTWSLKLSSLPTNSKLSSFFSWERKLIQLWNDYILRGADYIVALDPTMRSKQKTNLLISTIIETVPLLIDISSEELSTEDLLWYLGVADYAKNATITLFNTLVFPEKQWSDMRDNNNYLFVRKELLSLMEKFVGIYYWLLIDKKWSHINYQKSLSDVDVPQILSLIKCYLCESMFSRNLSRPEATHPLIVLWSLWLHVKRFPETDIVIALPWWSTELWMLSKIIYKQFLSKDIALFMLPVSFHSWKSQSFLDVSCDEKYQLFSEMVKDISSEGKNVALLDDNSSTWKTLQYVVDLLSETGWYSSLVVSVAEADLIRTTIDRDNYEKRSTAWSPSVYNQSVWILPVSKTYAPKYDIKELQEQSRLANFYKQKHESLEWIDSIIYYLHYTAVSDPTENHISENVDITNETERSLEEQKNNSVIVFRWSFLSNFYPCKILYNSLLYPSVEHWYQAQKYSPNVFAELSANELCHINELLKIRWHSVVILPDSNVFTDSSFTSWNIKVITQYLDSLWKTQAHRNNRKLWVMIELLLQKYSDPTLAMKLQQTNEKYLIEWNTWNDVFWGRSNNRWANYLWRIIMYMRDHYNK